MYKPSHARECDSRALSVSLCLAVSLTVSLFLSLRVYVSLSLYLSLCRHSHTIMPTMYESGKSQVTNMIYQTYESYHKHQLTVVIAYGLTQKTARAMDTVTIMPTNTAALSRVRQERVRGRGWCRRSREIRPRVR